MAAAAAVGPCEGRPLALPPADTPHTLPPSPPCPCRRPADAPDGAAVPAAVLSLVAAGDASSAGALAMRAFQTDWCGATTLAMLQALNGMVLQLGCRHEIQAAIAGGAV